MRERSIWAAALTAIGVAGLVACAHSESTSGDDTSSAQPSIDPPAKTISAGDTPPPPEGGPTPPPPPPGDAGAGDASDASVGPVFAATFDTLYGFDPTTKALSPIGKLTCLMGDQIIDLAVSETGWVYVVAWNHFASVDPKTGTCSAQIGGIFPNSLTFAPIGTVDPANEVLVGYAMNPANSNFTERYVKVSTITGAITDLGNLNGSDAGVQYQVSGDIIALAKTKRAFVTVRPQVETPTTTDLLAEVNLTTGAIISIIGDTKMNHLYGLAYWDGVGYGFAENGDLVSLDIGTAATAPVLSLGDGGAWYAGGMPASAP
jgi:hypothetical protein